MYVFVRVERATALFWGLSPLTWKTGDYAKAQQSQSLYHKLDMSRLKTSPHVASPARIAVLYHTAPYSPLTLSCFSLLQLKSTVCLYRPLSLSPPPPPPKKKVENFDLRKAAANFCRWDTSLLLPPGSFFAGSRNKFQASAMVQLLLRYPCVFFSSTSFKRSCLDC